MTRLDQAIGICRSARPRVTRNNDFVAVAADLLLAWDFTAVLVSGYLSALAWRLVFPGHRLGLSFPGELAELVVCGAVLSPALLRDPQLATSGAAQALAPVLARLLRRGLLLLGILLGLGFATRALDGLSRAWVVMWAASGLALVAAGRAGFAAWLGGLERRGVLREAVAIVGAGPLADRLIRHLHQVSAGRIEVVGVFDDRRSRLPLDCTLPRGTVADLVALGRGRPLDWVIVTLPPWAEARLAEVVHALKSLSVEVALCPTHVGLGLPHRQTDILGDLPVMLLADRPLRRWDPVVKALEDKLLAALLLALLSPVLLGIALAIRLETPGPVIFRQTRQGWNNGEFTVFKFRTMRWEGEPGPIRQTLRGGDPRVTRLGGFLRRSSLDELPQLINVLLGQMSLVGPRPHAVTMRTEDRLGHEIVAEYAHRHRVKPGITGWAQVNGLRGATERADQLRRRVEHDLHYIENWSLLLDLKILALTSLRVFAREGAF